MIQLSRLHGAGTLLINADLIETVEAHPDTTITLLTKRRFVVSESVDDVVDRMVAWRQRCWPGAAGSTRVAIETQLHDAGQIDSEAA